jgi:hypothetical protein
MPDPSAPPVLGSDEFALEAFLYVTGELNATQAATFESHLGENQAAREALCHAARVYLFLRSPVGAGPDPVYREQVRQRLSPAWRSVG